MHKKTLEYVNITVDNDQPRKESLVTISEAEWHMNFDSDFSPRSYYNG